MLGEEGAGLAGVVWGQGAWWGCMHPGVLAVGLLCTSLAQGE